MFSNLSASSISLATVTPSLVMRGAPNDLSMTTLRPLGPSVTFTASARMLTPRSIFSRASAWNFTSLAAIGYSFEQAVCVEWIVAACSCGLLHLAGQFDHAHHVALL